MFLILTVAALGCGKADDGCPEGTKRFGEEPPRGFETTCKKEDPGGEWIAHGPQKKWHMNGQLQVETSFVDGAEEGTRVELDTKGNKQKASAFAKGVKHGTSVEWYPSGAKHKETQYSRGERQGVETEYYPEGQKRAQTTYNADKPVAAGRRWYENGVVMGEIEWVAQRGGTYTMGAAGERNNEPRDVTVAPFEIARTEVTVDQFRLCLDDRKCTLPKTGPICNWGQPGRGAHPVNCVDWDQASAFATWANARLPTEAEWEFAARSGGADQRYPWGQTEASCQVAVLGEGGDGCGKRSTWPACSKPKGHTAQGVCDLGGNVWEWVADAKGRSRIFKGGSFNSHAKYLRASTRRSVKPSMRTPILGFRVARDAE